MNKRLFLVLSLLILVGAMASFAAEPTFQAVRFEEVDSGMPYNVPEVPVADPKSMEGIKVALVCAHGFEEVEGTYPLRYLRARGAHVDVITPDWIKGRVMAVRFLKPSVWIPVTKTVSEANPTDYCSVIIPGGAWNPIIMRTDGKILDFVQKAQKANKLIASICHGPQVLISAGLVKGREITGVGDIRTDLRNAGGRVVEDQHVVVDGNILTSRDPNDLAQFCQAFEEYLKKNLKFCHGQNEDGTKEGAAPQASMEQSTQMCPDCKGTGRLTGGPGNYPYACPKCHGTGKVAGNPNLPPVSTDH